MMTNELAQPVRAVADGEILEPEPRPDENSNDDLGLFNAISTVATLLDQRPPKPTFRQTLRNLNTARKALTIFLKNIGNQTR